MAFDVQHSALQQPPVVVDSAIDRVVPPWVHFAAGASGGLITSIVTSPLDVLRTRMQSDLYLTTSRSRATSTTTSALRLASSPLRHIYETFETIGAIHRTEGWRNLFRGLLPSLVGVVPAQAIKFYAYGNCKRLGARLLGRTESDILVHAQAAVAAGIATATATNPIWLVKTRLQLDKKQSRLYSGVVDCVQQVFKKEGIRGFYRGLSASYLGTLETVVHLVLYERLKALFRKESASGAASSRHKELAHWTSTAAAAGCAKVAAVLITYPHEVFRTRLRQAPVESLVQVQQTSLVQCCRTTWVREGWRGFYAGLTPHLIRSVPSAIITFGVYEFVLRLAGARS
ncbi:Mitochondrial substrate carrier [Beauveria brongniartii RCEF 3172]|uniref:Mitochondrial substrate carrier n=1 Tax=Beauveria brongniartii RCEF 3172 TaxID=1081107 RepID=A0A166RTM6_9HYPO|nr:Mitochondrial substrate carrier [Beauveria brongniartii RCEF 3172]